MSWEPSDELVQKCLRMQSGIAGMANPSLPIRIALQAAVESGELVPAHDATSDATEEA